MKLNNLLLIIICLTLILVVNIDTAAAFSGQNLVVDFWELISNLLNLLFFNTDSESDSSTEPVTSKPPTVENWQTRGVEQLTRGEQKMLELINQVRRQHQLNPVKLDKRLVKIARAKSRDLVDNNYFSHYSPNYGSPFDMMEELQINYYLAGENIAGAPEVRLAHQQLMKSKSHRENILHPDFNYVGVGIAVGGPYGKMYTQEFTNLIE